MPGERRIQKLVYMLTNDARAKTKEIAKALNTSQQNASSLLPKLKEENYIVSYDLLVDSSKFGFSNFCVLLSLKKYSRQSVNDLVEGLEAYSDVTCIDILFGNFDLFLRFTSPNASHFNKQLKQILADFSGMILNYRILTQIVLHHYSSNYLSKDKSGSRLIISGDREMVDVDKTDRQIIDMLNENSRRSASAIANKLGLSAKTVIERKKQLEKRKIIKGYTATFNHTKLGISRYYLLLKMRFTDPEQDKLFLRFTRHQDNIIEVIKVFGDWDVILLIETMGTEDFKKLLLEIKSSFADALEDYVFLESEEVRRWGYICRLE